jgi:uncharacterized protein YceH (UPF0502 family)
MDIVFDPVETRVLACLIEKEITTPEYYPLTLNALINACNQKSNRDPVVSFDEDAVSEAIDRLRERRMVTVLTGGSNRVPKYGHRVQDTLNLGRRELALLCELMLRGPQTVGELRDRAGRMQRFSDIEETEACLRALAEHPGGALATELARQPGRKEPRFAHLLSGEPELSREEESRAAPHAGGQDLRERVAELESRVAELEAQFAKFRQQFE